jgi:hypothetical protein
MNAYGAPTAYVNSNPNNPVQGMLRYQNGRLEVFEGSGWIMMNMNISVGLDAEGEEAIAWTRKRMAQEKRWAELSRCYPAVADAIAARDRADAALSMVAKLCGELET